MRNPHRPAHAAPVAGTLSGRGTLRSSAQIRAGERPMVALNDRPLGETLDRRRRWLLLISLMCAMFMGALDQTIMATAAPKIVANLGGFSLLSWIFTTYMLTSTVVGPLVGKLSDIYGRKPFLLAGMVIFLVSSAGCGAAPNMGVLIA